MNILIAGSAIALGTVLAMATPAQAQAVCDLADGLATENTGGATATNTGDFACGTNATANSGVGGSGATAVGTNSKATGDTTVALGNGAEAGPLAGGATLDHDGVAIGDKAKSTGFHSTAIGGEAVASGGGSQAFGWKALASGTQTTAVGNQTQAIGNNSTALGNGAIATGDNSLALGRGALTAGVNSVAIGQGASTAAFTNSVALGTGTTATANNQVNVGGRTIGGVAAGVLASDAVNKAQLDAAVGGINNGIAALQGGIDTLFDLRSTDRRDMKQGVASAMAMAQAPMPSAAGGISYAVNGATFRGEYAVGGSLMYRLNTESPMAISIGASFAGNKNNGARVGIAGEF
jgi:autotransporter adhesin